MKHGIATKTKTRVKKIKREIGAHFCDTKHLLLVDARIPNEPTTYCIKLDTAPLPLKKAFEYHSYQTNRFQFERIYFTDGYDGLDGLFSIFETFQEDQEDEYDEDIIVQETHEWIDDNVNKENALQCPFKTRIDFYVSLMQV